MPDGLPLQPGDPAELGGHRLLRRLGEGTQGIVYLGRAPSGEQVAIKLLHARMAGDPGARERFIRELSAAKKVARFCTAHVLDADVAGDHPYIVSEYVQGRSLRSHIIAEGPRTDGALERLAISTLTALAAIHRAGIIHRDFTPHNVLLGPDGPRVIDFGIARALGSTGNDESNRAGTPSYMAPEQITDGEIGPPADLFAWGSTILFAATGRPPFGNEAVHAVMRRIVQDEPDVSALPEPLRSVVAACLAKNPAQRPTAQQAQAGLLGHEATEALMPPPAFGAPALTPQNPAPEDQAASTSGEPATPSAPRAVGPGKPSAAAGSPAPSSGGDPAAPGLAVGLRSAERGGRPEASGGSGAGRAPGRSALTPTATATAIVKRRWVGWAVLAGAAVIIAGAAVAVPLWPDGGDAAIAPKVRVAASTPATPTPQAPATRQPQLNGIRSGVPKPTPKKYKPAKGCLDYERAYGVTRAGSVLLKVSVCRGAYTGTAVLGDTAPKDGWDICLQLRGHVTGTPPTYVSTTLSSRDGRVRAFDNGPKARFGAKTKRTEDSVTVNVGRCRGSGVHIQTSWQTQQQLAAG
jgi:predicted Ser/Thr protein kinase